MAYGGQRSNPDSLERNSLGDCFGGGSAVFSGLVLT